VADKQAIELRHLMSMSSGLLYEYTLPAMHGGPKPAPTEAQPEALKKQLELEIPYKGKPGTGLAFNDGRPSKQPQGTAPREELSSGVGRNCVQAKIYAAASLA